MKKTEGNLIRDKVIQVISATIATVDAEEITSTASLVDDLGLDSLDVVELIMAVEEKFGIEISDEDVIDEAGEFRFNTVRAIEEYLGIIYFTPLT